MDIIGQDPDAEAGMGSEGNKKQQVNTVSDDGVDGASGKTDEELAQKEKQDEATKLRLQQEQKEIEEREARQAQVHCVLLRRDRLSLYVVHAFGEEFAPQIPTTLLANALVPVLTGTC